VIARGIRSRGLAWFLPVFGNRVSDLSQNHLRPDFRVADRAAAGAQFCARADVLNAIWH
jgi:hypothetical protein